MPTNNIGWDESKPANTDDLGDGDDEIRSFKTAVRTGLSAEHLWPSSSGAAGAHLLGSARVYVGARSAVSSDGTRGRLMLETDAYSLWGDGTGTGMVLLGSQFITTNNTPSGASYSANNKFFNSFQFGTGNCGSSGTTLVTFGGSGYSGIPFVMVCAAGTADLVAIVQTVSATTALVTTMRLSTGALSSGNFHWMSFGTINSGIP